MKKFISPLIILSLMLGLAACQPGNQEAEETTDEEMMDDDGTTDQDPMDEDSDMVTINPAPEFPQFENSKLMLQDPAEGTEVSPGEVQFNFNVQNYELGVATENAENIMLAKSDKGQHIHFILNNNPYSAHYEPSFTKEMPEGNHVVLAFLSRSYHAGVKHKDAFVVKQFSVGNADDSQQADLTAPHMFYSRPKGTYTGPDQTQKILLDFYLVNTDLSNDGNKVRAVINNDQEFMLDNWQPYVIEGLPMGENTIMLELLDSEGNPVDSPFNPVTRTITLEDANM